MIEHKHEYDVVAFVCAEKAEDIVFPPGRSCHVLVTSRSRESWPDGTEVHLETLYEREAVALLLKASDRDDKAGAAAEVARFVVYLPLAVAQVAAYVKAERVTFEQCVTTLEGDRQNDGFNPVAGYQHQEGAVVVLDVVLRTLEGEPAVVRLLQALSLLATSCLRGAVTSHAPRCTTS